MSQRNVSCSSRNSSNRKRRRLSDSESDMSTMVQGNTNNANMGEFPQDPESLDSTQNSEAEHSSSTTKHLALKLVLQDLQEDAHNWLSRINLELTALATENQMKKYGDNRDSIWEA